MGHLFLHTVYEHKIDILIMALCVRNCTYNEVLLGYKETNWRWVPRTL